MKNLSKQFLLNYRLIFLCGFGGFQSLLESQRAKKLMEFSANFELT